MKLPINGLSVGSKWYVASDGRYRVPIGGNYYYPTGKRQRKVLDGHKPSNHNIVGVQVASPRKWFPFCQEEKHLGERKVFCVRSVSYKEKAGSFGYFLSALSNFERWLAHQKSGVGK